MEKDFRTEGQKRRERKEMEIYLEYQSLASDPKKSKVVINQYLCEKYDIACVSTIYSIRRRVEQRLAQKGGAK